MKLLYKLYGNRFIWIDHHAPIINESYKLRFDNCVGWRDTSRSAILNAYRYFYDPLDEAYNERKNNKDSIRFPELLRILSAYDSWSFKREKLRKNYVVNINKGVTVYFNLDVYKVIEYIEHILYGDLNTEYIQMKTFISKMSKLGKEYINYDNIKSENQLKEYGDFNWYGNNRPAVMLMVQGPTSSLIFESVKDKYLNGIILKRLPNSEWIISLYNTNDNDEFHCGDYLKENYKGGGHQGAAGCTITQKQFIKLIFGRK